MKVYEAIIGLVLLCVTVNQAQFKLSGYGEMLYQHFDYGPNQRASANGSLPDSRSNVDIPRFVVELKNYFKQGLYVEAEIEFEHLGTGSSLELDYDEFGEYEQEVEKGGEINLEEFHITKEFSDMFNLRAGRIILPVGLLNSAHRPTQYFTTVRPESESQIIPEVWSETGVELFGRFDDIKYRLQIVNGLESTGFSSAHWIAEGHQSKFEIIKATNLAYVARFDYSGIENITFGLSGYYGNSSGNRPKPEDMNGADGNVSITDVHAVYDDGSLITRAMFLYGTLENSALISRKNAGISVNIQAARTPVAKGVVAYYMEAGYDILKFFSPGSAYKLFPFGKFEYYNSMQDVESGVFANPRFKRYLITCGLNFFVLQNLVIKADYTMRKTGGFNSNYNNENTIGLSIGFFDTFIK